MNNKLSIFIMLYFAFGLGCDSYKRSNTENPNINIAAPNINIGNSTVAEAEADDNFIINAYIYGGKNGTGITFLIDKKNKFGIGEVRFNKQLLQKETNNDRVEFRGSRLPFQKENDLVIITNDGTEQLFEIPFQPLDFDVVEPFIFHRTKSNSLKLSKVYDSPTELWLAIYDNYLGVFKEIAELNETKDSVVIPQSVANRMSVGDSKISLSDVRYGRVESQNRVFSIEYKTSYESQIKLKVVR